MHSKILVLAVALGSLAACSEQGGDQPTGKSTGLVGQAGQAAADMQAATDAAAGQLEATATQAADAAQRAAAETAAAVDNAAEDMTATAQQTADAAQTGLQQAADAAGKTVDTAVLETATVAAGVIPPEQLDMGKRIYSGNCMTCHSPGIAGAPKLGDQQAWSVRIAQGMDTLNEHAIKGFKGSTGYMPPKGGYASLNDDEVKAAVAYMVLESQ